MEAGISSAHVIVTGFGVPGRAVAEWLSRRLVSYCVIERNPDTVVRCTRGGEHIIEGDARDPDVLARAGIDKATLIVVAVPEESTGLEITRAVRALNSKARIITRCHYISAGLEAKSIGAS